MTYPHRRLDTALTICHEAGLIPCGPYLIKRSVFQADIDRQFQYWNSNIQRTKDFGYPNFIKVWHTNHFGLVHMATPIPLGREAWICAWYATLIEPCLDLDDKLITNNKSVNHMYTVFAVYETFTLWATQPFHFGPRINVPISPCELKHLSSLVTSACSDLHTYTNISDVVHVMARGLDESMFSVSVIGQRGPTFDQSPTGRISNRWLTGCAGPGWTNWLQVVYADEFTAFLDDNGPCTDHLDTTMDQWIQSCKKLDRAHIITPNLLNRTKIAAEKYGSSGRQVLLTNPASSIMESDISADLPTATPGLLELTNAITHKLENFKLHRSARLNAVLKSFVDEQDSYSSESNTDSFSESGSS